MKKFKIFLSAVAIMASTFAALAQNITVTGTVKDVSGEPIVGANVVLNGSTTVYALTDVFGSFTLNVPPKGTLNVYCLGYAEQNVPVNDRTVINIVLADDSQLLDETIVVAYGVQKKSSFTGSATQLSGEKLKKMQTSNVAKSLEGEVAGLQTASSSGTPGSGASIQIRGFGSVSASTSPLLVVDGVPYEGGLNSIPTQDIESITVLKDAAANSMYGARGSNGVIMITTKRGQIGKVNVTFEAKVGVNSRAVPAYDVISDPGEYYEMTWEAIRNSAYYTGVLDLAQANIYASNDLLTQLGPYNVYVGVADNEIVDPTTGKLNSNAFARKWNDNWNKDVFKNGIRQEYNISASGGSDRTQAYMSASYLKDDGYVPMSGFTRISFRGKIDHRIGKYISTGLNVAYSNTNQQTYVNSEGNNYSNLFMFSQSIAPIYPIYLYDQNGMPQYDEVTGDRLYDWGETGRAYAGTSNPYGQLMGSINSVIRDNLSSRGYVNVNILKDLVFSANVAYDVFNSKSVVFYTPNGGDAKNFNGRAYHTLGRTSALNTNQLLTWTPTFGEHSLNVLLGHEIKTDSGYELEGHMTDFVNSTNPDFANAVDYQNLTSSSSSYFLQGFFSRVEYNYANRYFFTGSLRRDGSSRFAADKRWGNFWAVSAAWNAANESFMKNVDWVNALKIKASYGTQGNDSIGLTRVYENLYSINRVDGEAALEQTFRAAPEVTWEKSNNFNIGIDGRLFNRLNFNVEYFVKETKDMIYYRPLPASQGSPSSQLVNDMDMMNKGIEFELSGDVIKTRDLTWTIGLNGTHYKNKLTKLPSDYPEWGKQVGNFYRELGGSLYEYYLYEYAGVDPENGHALYNQYKKDDKTGLATDELVKTVTSTSEATYRKIGKTPIPDLYGGFNTSLRFKGFDFSANFAYQIGGYTLDSVYRDLMQSGRAGSNWHKDIFNRWTSQNTGSDVPRVQMNDQTANETSTRWLIRSDYISLRNATIGYTLPKSLTEKISVETLRIFVTGDNLWYLSRRKGMDVRKSFSGANGNTYSALRTVSAGVTVTF